MEVTCGIDQYSYNCCKFLYNFSIIMVKTSNVCPNHVYMYRIYIFAIKYDQIIDQYKVFYQVFN